MLLDNDLGKSSICRKRQRCLGFQWKSTKRDAEMYAHFDKRLLGILIASFRCKYKDPISTPSHSILVSDFGRETRGQNIHLFFFDFVKFLQIPGSKNEVG